jgi:hypothetical protein
MMSFVFFLLLQITPAARPAAPPPAPSASPFPVQLGASVTPDTVTIGQRFIVLLKVRAPAGATIQFPLAVDSAAANSPTAAQIIGAPFVDSVRTDSTGTTRAAAYRFAAWDVGVQPLGLGKIAVTVKGRTAYVSLNAQTVFVRSVLPADTTLRQPKPPRPPIVLQPFNWLPWLALLAAILLALLAWWLWRWYRRRRAAPLPPFETAEREFNRIEAMRLVDTGEPERHVALMTDVLRDYLAARVEGVQRSQTTSELVAGASPIRPYASGLEHVLASADLVKFARQRVSPGDAQALGAQARTIVREVEDHFVQLEKEKTEKKAA